MQLESYVEGHWYRGTGQPQQSFNAVTGEPLAEITSNGVDYKGTLDFARKQGAAALGAMTFHARARMLKSLAQYLNSRKSELYKLAPASGATKGDAWLDIDGGIGTLFAFASKGKKEFPDQTFYVEGEAEQISRTGTFIGHHLCVPLQGAAVHINAFNFPCWGMLEKLACNLLAGVPAIVKPASVTAYLTEAMVRQIIESGILPPGALQLICGSIGDLFDHLTCQDVVTFTGSAATGRKLKQHPAILQNSVRFNMEADSLNFSMLGPDAVPGTPEFDLFIKEVSKEITVKAGQKCTAIRRTIVPSSLAGEVLEALKKRLSSVTVGDPANDKVRMGPLVSREQLADVQARIGELRRAGELVYGSLDNLQLLGGSKEKGAFCAPTLIYCSDPLKHPEPHEIEAFGPVSTIMPYQGVEQAVELAKLGRGSLVGSLFTADDQTARTVVLGTAAYHGRLMLINRSSAAESTGHGSPLPHLVHGGPGRAGGGEEMGGKRGVLHYMQRTALQGSPSTLSAVMGQYLKGADRHSDRVHPFRKYFEELKIGEALITHRRTITEADVVNFAGISGDFFYAHMDDIAARQSLFERRVAHGYFVIAAAAGLFVDPAPGPVLANYGMEGLRFVKPVYIGDSIYVKLTCKSKTAKDVPDGVTPQGVVAWDVEVLNQADEAVALYTILTLVKRTIF